MLKFTCTICEMTASFEESEYAAAVEEGDTPLVCDCCGEGVLVEVKMARSESSRTQEVWDKALGAAAKKIGVSVEGLAEQVSFVVDRVLAGEQYVWAESDNLDLLDRLEVVAMRYVRG